MPSIVTIGLGKPDGYYSQRQLFDAMSQAQKGLHHLYWYPFRDSGIAGRPLYTSPEEMVAQSAEEQQEKYVEAVIVLSKRAMGEALEKARISSERIGQLVFASCTGVPACPSFPSLLAGEMGMGKSLLRYPLSGIGCQGAGPALRAAWEHLRLYPQEFALVVCCEISGACYHPRLDVDGVVDSGLITGEAIFGDGAACALLSGMGSGLELLDFDQQTEYKYKDKIGMAWLENRYRLVLARDVPELVVPIAEELVLRLLQKAGWSLGEVRHVVVHSGGASIIRKLQEKMGLKDSQVRYSWETWGEVGNLSSATVLFALARMMKDGDLQRGDKVAIITLGAGIEADAILGVWQG